MNNRANGITIKIEENKRIQRERSKIASQESSKRSNTYLIRVDTQKSNKLYSPHVVNRDLKDTLRDQPSKMLAEKAPSPQTELISQHQKNLSFPINNNVVTRSEISVQTTSDFKVSLGEYKEDQ